jgi:hypothetical protein
MGQTIVWAGVRDKRDLDGASASKLLAVSQATNRCTVCACLGRECRGPHSRGPFRFCESDINLVIAIEREVAHRPYHDA